MNFTCFLIIVLNTEEIWQACLTEEEAIKTAKNLADSSGYEVIVEKVSLTNEQIIAYINSAINSDYGCSLEMFGLPEDYFRQKEQERAEKELEEFAKLINIMNKED